MVGYGVLTQRGEGRARELVDERTLPWLDRACRDRDGGLRLGRMP